MSNPDGPERTLKMMWSPSETILRSLSRGFTAPKKVVCLDPDGAATHSRVQFTSNEIVILDDFLLGAVPLLIRTHHVSCPRPEQVVAQQHSNRTDVTLTVSLESPVFQLIRLAQIRSPVAFGNFANNLVSHVPRLTASAKLHWSKDSQQAG
jgi:hypothetical protein